MDKQSCICVLDSGIGGLPYLAHMRRELPWYRYCYISDTAAFPYGEKSSGDLLLRLTELVEWCRQTFRVQACVIACNTASVTAIAALREKFPDFPFIGVVPAVKPAAAASVNKNIGILATRRTVEDPYLQNLITSYAADTQVLTIAAGELVSFIEKNLYLPDPDMECLNPFVQRIKEKNSDVLVLGCTHFLHIREELEQRLGETVKIIDSRDGVTRQLQRVLHGMETEQKDQNSSDIQSSDWYSTAAFEITIRQKIASLFNLRYQDVTL